MNGIILINKPKNYTSRDIVNIIGKKFNTKKVGHTGTLDPLATGVLVLCMGKYTKLVELLTAYDKEYVATAIIGIETDTLDITGKIIREENIEMISEEKINDALNHFKGKYMQEVPKYSSIKVNGKKLYEYARNNEDVNLPKREVEIKDIELLERPIYDNYKIIINFKVLVSKGTYIRSLIRDIGIYLGVPATMQDLKRTKQGNFKISECNNIDDSNYKILDIKDILNYPIIKIDNSSIKEKILNGALIDKIYNFDTIMFELDGEIISIYKISKKDKTKMKPYKMLIS